jgi:hypothetical protein
MVGDHAGRFRLRRSNHASFIAPRCNNRGGKVAGLRKCSKNDLTRHPTPRTMRPLHSRIQQPYTEWVP